jgi:hypothetical protein
LTSCGAISAQEKIDQVKQKNRDALLNSRRELANSDPRQNNQNQSPEALFNRRPSFSTVTSYNIPTSSFNQNSPYFHQNRQNSPTPQRSNFQQTSFNSQQRTIQSRQQNQFNTFSQFSSTSQGESISAASQVEILNLRGSNQ